MTQKEQKEEDDEVRSSMAQVSVSTKTAEDYQANRQNKELADLQTNSIPGVKFQMVQNKPTRWVLLLTGPANSVYAGEDIIISVGLLKDYPYSAPVITMMSPIQHPCV